MLDTLQAMSLLTIMEIIGPVVFAAALIYGTVQWRRRRAAAANDGQAATRRLYREENRREQT